jgi:eukaryotic-like serine/threonine-protein kinase
MGNGMSVVFDRYTITESAEGFGGFLQFRGQCKGEPISLWIEGPGMAEAKRESARDCVLALAALDSGALPRIYGLEQTERAGEILGFSYDAGRLFFATQHIGDVFESDEPWVVLEALLRGLTDLHAAGLAHGALSSTSLHQSNGTPVLWEMGVFLQSSGKGMAVIGSDLQVLGELGHQLLGASAEISQKTWCADLKRGGVFASGGEAKRRANRWLPSLGNQSLLPLRLQVAGADLHALRPVALQGRDAELAMLENALGGAEREDSVYTVVLHGPPGSGRTHLIEAFCADMESSGRAITFRSVHGPSPMPLSGLAGLVSSFFGVGFASYEQSETVVSEGVSALGLCPKRHAPGLLALLREHLDGKPLLLRQANARFSLLKAFLKEVCAHRPLILWVDDAQWGADVLNFCEFLREEEEGLPILIVLAVREGWPSEVVRGAAGLTVPRQGPRTLWMHVMPLAVEVSLKIGRESLGLEEDLAALLAGGSRGLPLIASQAEFLWFQSELIAVQSGRLELLGTDLPVLKSGTRQIWAARLGVVTGGDPEALELLELAAAFGAQVNLNHWAVAAKQMGQACPRDLVHDLLVSGLLKGSMGGFFFVHESFKAYLDHTAEREGRRMGQHKACAMTLMSSGLEHTAQLWERIGRHLLAGGQGDAALPALLRAARLHGARANFEAALGLLVIRDKVMRDLGVDERNEKWGTGWVQRAAMLRGMGRLDESAKMADRAVDEAQANSWQSVLPLSLRALALVALEMEDISSAGTLLRRSRELFEKAGELGEVADCSKWQGRVLLRRGNQASSERYFSEAAEMFCQLNSDLNQASSLYWAGVVQRQQGKLDLALDSMTRAQALFSDSGDWEGVADCQLGCGLVWFYRGDLDQSEALQKKAFSLHQRLHNDVGAADCLNGLAEVARYRGDLETAEENYRNAAAILSSVRVSRAVLPQVNLALILLQRGQDAAARRLLETICSSVERQGKRALLGAVHVLFLVLAAGEAEAMNWARHFRKASSLLAETGAVDPDIAWAAQTSAERALEAGHRDRARMAYELAQVQWSRLQRKDKVSAVEQALLFLDVPSA